MTQTQAEKERKTLNTPHVTKPIPPQSIFSHVKTLFLYVLGGLLLAGLAQPTLKTARGLRQVDQQRAAQEAAQEAAQKEKQKAKQEREQAEKRIACKQDLQCWGDEQNIYAQIACRESIERLAKYSYQWTKEDSWLDRKFSQWKWKSKPDVITFLGDEIKFQNRFGAWQPYVYACDFNTATNTALRVWAQPGRLE